MKFPAAKMMAAPLHAKALKEGTGIAVYLQASSVLVGQRNAPALLPRERPGTHRTGG